MTVPDTTFAPGIATSRMPMRWVIVVAAVGAVALPWLVDDYTLSIATYALVAALLALSTHLLAGVAGLPSLGQAAYLGVGAYTAALIGRNLSTSGPVQLIAATALAVGAAALVGPLITRTRGIAFLLTTWALAELAHTIADHTTTLTGGGNGLTAPPVSALPGLAPLTADGPAYLYVLGCFTIIAVGIGVLVRTRFALIVRGIADHEDRQRANGHRVDAYLYTTYLLAAGLAGAAGALLVAARRYVGPADLGFDISALALLAAIIGRRSPAGAAAAAIGIVAIRDIAGNQLTGFSPVLLGALFIAVALASNDALARLCRTGFRRRQ